MSGFTPMVLMERQTKSKCSKILLRFFASAICILGVLLVILITIVIRSVSKDDNLKASYILDGKYATTITSCGFIQGLVVNESYAFLGVQYALPPVGKLRWQFSQPHNSLDQCWNGTYQAFERRKPCWQFYRNGSYDGSENCLFLDLYTPKLYYDTPLPVVVFISGESLNGGESSDLQPSAELAKQRNCIFVSVSIRRSVLGFLSLNILSQSSPRKSSGNYGLSDLLTSLLWVKYNIRHFGGSPNKITVLGHQSGATLLAALLKSVNRGNDLFQQLWISGGKVSNKLINLEEADKQNLEFLEQTGCQSTRCLYDMSPEELLENVPNSWRTFHHDLPSLLTEDHKDHEWLVTDEQIIHSIEKMEITHQSQKRSIPFVVGSSMHIDASPEMRVLHDWNNTGKFKEYLDRKFGPYLAAEAMRLYLRPDTNHWQQFSSMLSDFKTICPMIKMTLKYFSSDTASFYVVVHTHKTPLGYLAPPHIDIKAILSTTVPKSFRESRYYENMSSLFYNFVNTGSVVTLAYPSKQKIFIVDDQMKNTDAYEKCDFWNRFFLLKQSQQNQTT